MTTTEQRDKRVETRQTRLNALAPKLTVLDERVEKFDEDMKTKREKLTARRDRTKARVAQLTNEIEWFKSMPVDGTPDSEDSDELAASDEPDTDESPAGVEYPGEQVTTRQRDERGHFVPANA